MTVDSGKESFRIGFLTAVEVPERGFVGGLLVTNHFGRPLEFQCTAPLKPNRTQEILYGPTLVPYVLGDLIGRTLVEKVAIKPHIVLTERDDLLALRDLVSIPVACVDDVGSSPAPPVRAANDTSAWPDGAADSAPADSAPAANSQPTSDAERQNASQSDLPSDPPEGVSVATTVAMSEVQAASITDAPAEAGTDAPAEKVASFSCGGAESAYRATWQFRLGRQYVRLHAAHEADQGVVRKGAGVVPGDADLREPFERVREALHEATRTGDAR